MNYSLFCVVFDQYNRRFRGGVAGSRIASKLSGVKMSEYSSTKRSATGGADATATMRSETVSADESVALEQYKLRILQENARDGGFALLMACVAYAALLVNHVELSRVVPWLTVAIAIVATRFTVIARYFNSPNEFEQGRYRKTVAINVILLSALGCAFGIAPFLYGVENYLLLAYSNLWCAGIASGLFVSQGIAPIVAYAFAVPALSPILCIYLFSGDVSLTLIALANLLLLGFLLVFSSRIRSAFLEEVMHRTKYERLAAHYEQQKARGEYLVAELSEEVERRKDAEILLRKARDDAETKSNQDHLTGLSNRRVFDKVLAREWFRGMRNQTPLSLVFCEIDAFSDYTNLYGLHAGDQCLISVANTIIEHTKRAGDFIARYGNEEFALVLPDTTEMSALEIAESFRQGIYEQTILHAGAPVERVVTASLGVATVVPEEQLRYGELIRIADNALSQAKRSGGNCVVTIERARRVDDEVND